MIICVQICNKKASASAANWWESAASVPLKSMTWTQGTSLLQIHACLLRHPVLLQQYHVMERTLWRLASSSLCWDWGQSHRSASKVNSVQLCWLGYIKVFHSCFVGVCFALILWWGVSLAMTVFPLGLLDSLSGLHTSFFPVWPCLSLSLSHTHRPFCCIQCRKDWLFSRSKWT